MKSLLLSLAIVLVMTVAGPTTPAGAQGKPDDAMRAAFEESKSSSKGLMFHIKGTTIGGAVTAYGDKFVSVKNQAGIAVIRIDSIDAVAGAITLK